MGDCSADTNANSAEAATLTMSQRRKANSRLRPALPISTRTTRLLSYQQQTSSSPTTSTCSGASAASSSSPGSPIFLVERMQTDPAVQTTPPSSSRSTPVQRHLVTPPPPSMAPPQTSMNIGNNVVVSRRITSSGTAKQKPTPPKRSESTRLTSGAVATTKQPAFQTKTFIMNLDRVIEQKKAKGNGGLSSLPVPLPPRPSVCPDCPPSYLDTDDLPPPPAELLEGLREMRRQTGTLIVGSAQF